MIKVAAFTSGAVVPSARFRIRQYIPVLRALGVDVCEYPARLGAYPPRWRLLRPFWGVASLASRLPDLAASQGAQVTMLQRGLLSKYLTLERFTSRPRVLDVDDAIWLPGGVGYASGLARLSDHLICGNHFLAEQFSRWHERVSVIPTAVDVHRFVPAAAPPTELRIGWSGSSSGLRYLESIEGGLARVLARFPRATLRVVCDRPPRFRDLPSGRVEFVPWRAEAEVAVLQDLCVGIMPIDDSLWSRGKCSYKMLTYMACGVPVVVSPFGMNAEVLARGPVGLPAVTEAEWEASLGRLLDDELQRRSCGEAGRRVVEEHYSIERLAPRLARVFQEVAGGRARTAG